MEKILVTYASRAGSTAKVAEAIANTLRENGLSVELHPIQDVETTAPYQAVVAGSAIQEGAWLPEAMNFINRNQQDLRRKPFAAFLVCMTMAIKNPQSREIVPVWMETVRALVPTISEGYFAGVLDLPRVPSLRQRLMFRLSVALGVWDEGDHRDWEAIRAWAAGLVPLLRNLPDPLAL